MERLRPYRNIAIGIGVAIVLIGGFLGFTAYRAAHAVPGEFKTARAEGGHYTQEITDLSKQVRDDLNIVHDRELKGQFKEGAALLADVQNRNATIKNDALELAKRLTTMASSADKVRNEAAQPLILDALSVHLKMIQNVIDYNASLAELADLLEERFQGKPVDQKHINELISKINDEVNAVNDLNTQATGKLQQFDDAIRGGK
jgi:hypothetical protein